MGNKNRVAYAICSAHGIDTTGMSPKEAWEKAKEVADKDEMVDLTEGSEQEEKEEVVDYNAKRIGKKQPKKTDEDDTSAKETLAKHEFNYDEALSKAKSLSGEEQEKYINSLPKTQRGKIWGDLIEDVDDAEPVDYNEMRMGKKQPKEDDDYDQTTYEDDVNEDDINQALEDFTWQITEDTTVGQYAESTAKKLGTTKEKVLEVMRTSKDGDMEENDKLAPYVFGEQDEGEFYNPDAYHKEKDNPQTKHKNESRKDKYGNSLVSDEAFNIGVKAAKDYIEESTKYGNDHNKLKTSNIYVEALQEAISDAISDAGLNPDFDMTYQDFNEIIGAATGDEIDIESDPYDSKFKAWTGKKYSGYQPKQEVKSVDYNALRLGKEQVEESTENLDEFAKQKKQSKAYSIYKNRIREAMNDGNTKLLGELKKQLPQMHEKYLDKKLTDSLVKEIENYEKNPESFEKYESNSMSYDTLLKENEEKNKPTDFTRKLKIDKTYDGTLYVTDFFGRHNIMYSKKLAQSFIDGLNYTYRDKIKEARRNAKNKKVQEELPF